jgi:hypothetical protein
MPGKLPTKMKILSILTILTCTALSAQVTVTSSPEVTNEVQTAYWKRALGQDATGYYLLRESGPISNQVTIVEKYSPAMKLVYSANIPGATGAMGDSKLHRLTELNNGKVLTFWEGWSKAEGQNSLVLKELNEDGTLAEAEFLLETEPATGQMKSANYSVSFSPDGSKMLVLTEKPYAKDSKEMLRLQVFSTDTYTSIWKQNLTLENEGAKYPENTIVVDNAGNAHVFKDIKITNKEHIYQLISADKDASKTELIDLKLQYPTYYKMQIDGTGNLVIAGMLAEQGANRGYWQSIWYLKANPAGDIQVNSVEPLGPDLLRRVVSEKQAMQEGARLSDYVLKDVLLKPDGGLLLIAEEQHDLKTIIGQTTPPEYMHDMRFGGIMVVSFTPDGLRDWNTFYDKQQSEQTTDENMHYGSFAYQLKNNQLYLVWNYTDLRTDAPVARYRYWIDRNGSKINIDNLYGKEALYPTLLTVINEDGSLQYTDRTFNALPLEAIQQPNAFPMAIDPSLFFATPNGIIVLSRMPGPLAKRYKFNTIGF